MDSPGSLDGLEVSFGDPRIPVLLQGCLCLCLTLVLAKGIFVDDSFIARSVKQGWSDPRLASFI